MLSTLSSQQLGPIQAMGSGLTSRRLEQDFTIASECLGSGAFGCVYRANNKIDGLSYAIKQIRFSSFRQNESSKLLREVYSLARLEHNNIVRYHSAWIEPTDLTTECSSSEDESENEDETFSLSLGNNCENSTEQPDPKECLSKSFPDTFLMPSRNYLNEQYPTPYNKSNNLSLFIQMQFCHFTLKDWISLRNEVHFNPSVPTSGCNSVLVTLMHQNINGIMFIFRQIVTGLDYIHSQGYIHRDLKPGNIFFYIPDSCKSEKDLVVKIGDFSLVSVVGELRGNVNCDASVKEKKPDELELSAEMTCGIGTYSYASPEQFSDSLQSEYNQKTDIFSLGVIFLELVMPFYSQTERIKTIEILRCKHLLPESFVEKYSAESAFILWCTNPDPEQRPTTRDILEFDLTHFSSTTESFEKLNFLDIAQADSGIFNSNFLSQKEFLENNLSNVSLPLYSIDNFLLKQLNEKEHTIQELRKKIEVLQIELKYK